MASLMMNKDNVDLIAMRSYVNPILHESEFWEDYDRIKYLKRLFNRYKAGGEVKTTLIMNHMTILFNVFQPFEIIRILLFKLPEHHDILMVLLEAYERLPIKIEPFSDQQPVLRTADIPRDRIFEHAIKERVFNAW